MAEQSFPFENIDTTESQFSQWASNFQDTGVQGSPTGTELKVTAEGSTLTVDVALGQAFLRGHYYINTESLPLTVTSAGLNTRIDYVVVELDPEANTIIAKILEGTAVESDPVAPTLTQSATGVYQLPIAKITIPNSTLAITNEMITDVRTFMSNRVGIWTTATRPTDPINFQTLGYNTTEEYHEYWDGTVWVAFVPPADSPNFVVDMNDSTNNTVTFEASRPAGPYSVSLSVPDSSFDIYLLNSEGATVGYSNSTAIIASEPFFGVCILGVETNQIVTFIFTGSVADTTSVGTATGAGAYLTNISPTDLPTIDDTATVTGGNFAADVEIYFESGATSLSAKSIVRNSATELIVTRPDDLVAELDPWSVRAINPTVPQPSGSSVNVLADVVDAGSLPVWVTGSNLPSGLISTSYSTTLEATDAEGSVTYEVTSGVLPTGLSLNSSTGVLSGTPSSGGYITFTVTATDEGNNTSDREFNLGIAVAAGGTTTFISGYEVHDFTSSGALVPAVSLSDVEYLVVAGGGGGAGSEASGYADNGGGGGGGGGVLTSIAGDTGAAAKVSLSATSYAVTIGAGGSGGDESSAATNGSNSSFAGFATAIGGGRGGARSFAPGDGGCGGGAGDIEAGGIGSQGGNGGTIVESGSYTYCSGGAGGGGASGSNGSNGEVGSYPGDNDATAGAGGEGFTSNAFGEWLGSGANGGNSRFEAYPRQYSPSGAGDGLGGYVLATSGDANRGGGGGGGNRIGYSEYAGAGGSGRVIIRIPA